MAVFPASTRRSFLLASVALGVTATARFPALAAPARGGTATLLLSAEPPVLTTIANTAFNSVYVSPKVIEGLLTYDFDLNPKPLLAKEWSVSQDGLAYTFKLRDGVKWHDGEPFTSADVAFSIKTLKEVHPRGRNTFLNLVDVQTPDPLTAVLTLSKPAPYLITALAASETPIVPRHIYEGTKVAENPANLAPIGTGAFKFKEWIRGSHIVYERNSDYWDQPRPYLDQLIVRFIPDAAARSIAIETGEIDLAPSTPVPLSDLERFKSLPDIAFEPRGYQYANGISRIEFNLERPFFKDIRVRQAFAHVIDRKVILNTINYGYGSAIPGPISPNLTKWYDPDLKTYPIDLAAAEKLLDEAGYPRGSDGIRARINLDYVPSGESYPRGSEYIRQALAKVGIDATVRSQDFATYTKRIYTDRDFDFAFEGMSNLFDPTVGVQRLYWSKNFKPGVPFSNGSAYSNPKVDALLEAAAIEVDPNKRVEQWREIQRILVEDLPAIDIVSQPELTIYNKRIADHTIGGEGVSGSLAYAYVAAS
ncbi:ABC transporter substrate-binding protein [Rhizobium leguminosarum]|uniref:ABC transporter substrate-binding protein n=1 Tax=Rhizobium leguminosarum TaxID=384 RepID=UPI001C91A810|nr:ABC transporter substrate-binding protein [Rhizobium leguminosarum]MBY2912514.1 ABC transporter substrate-binding protein [Rhizobium leguminosarum]MBY2968172.1 ABC transporter substrate-binding protein [Rhizobium leguminosarum]MBY2975547.1 ABC transporter substrate-binding protein [Rhizobium leguminosarum]MBY3004097.1 ABC transporter substrate-binding protein [Rhizobium leguminosarum]